jgi:hypothetical protein
MRLSRGGKASERVRAAIQPHEPVEPTVVTVAPRPLPESPRNRFIGVKLTPRAAERQGLVVKLALKMLTAPGAATAFLNSDHPKLGGRPLDLAVASEEGLAAVEALLAAK